ncbi:nuclear transport factor 2 family protein [Variovorax sp. dw_954]|uniref:nuclear transport factor 2 family protein n=1 Tax=Variovorax sp. dw_954 TaxID=2720078 RepID=UPI001BD49DC8|nr:nuclear transport factor 2 family protein [Variovorax sp. dw_954]
MPTLDKTLIDLETRFWQSMVDQDTDAALSLLDKRALMVSPQGTLQFDHAGYRKMAEEGAMVLTSFELSDVDVFLPNDATAILTYRVKQGVCKRGKPESSTTTDMIDTSTWVKAGAGWRCVAHTEIPAAAKQ